MIHEIVSSDVDFARGMMGSGHPDAEILAYLASRGLDPAKAAQLVVDLRHGRKPDTQLPLSSVQPVTAWSEPVKPRGAKRIRRSTLTGSDPEGGSTQVPASRGGL